MAKRRRLKSDRISNLPDNIIVKILVNLPIKDAVRTCLLSSEWKYRWASIPELVFDVRDFQNNSEKFFAFIDRILSVHRGPIQKFALSFWLGGLGGPSFVSWMQFLSKINIKEFKFKGHVIDHDSVVPSSLFTFQVLSSLELSGCIFYPPPLFEGFKYLKILYFKSVELEYEDGIFENMISNCPILEDLSLVDVNTSTRLKVYVPKLQSFHFRGYFTDIYLEGAAHLTDVNIYLNFASRELDVYRVTNLNNILGCLTGIKNLSLLGDFLEFLGMFNIPRCYQLPVSYHHLNKLSLKVNFKDLNQIKVTICLLKSSPNLRKLEIHVSEEINAHAYEDIAMDLIEDFWEAQGHLNSCTNHLNVIQFDDLVGSHSEMEFIKFLLANSPVLEVACVTSNAYDIDVDELAILKKLFKFRRASTKAEIEYKRDE